MQNDDELVRTLTNIGLAPFDRGLDLTVKSTRFHDMSDIAANAMIECARAQYAIPAQVEEAKARIMAESLNLRTKWAIWSAVGMGLFALALVAFKGDAKDVLTALCVLTGAGGFGYATKRITDRK